MLATVVKMRLEVDPPFDLEKTVRLLQRRPTNPLDRWAGGAWSRLLQLPAGLLLVEVRQPEAAALQLRMRGRKPTAAEKRKVAALVRRTLGLDVDLSIFLGAARALWQEGAAHASPASARSPASAAAPGARAHPAAAADASPPASARSPASAATSGARSHRAAPAAASPRDEPPPLLRLLEGTRPPRFTSLYEAILGVVPFQQISLDAGMTVFARLVEGYGETLDLDGQRYHAAPVPAAIAAAPVSDLRALGFSATKVRALQHAAAAILEGRLREDEIESLPTPAARERLLTLPGIGPWSADLILLRGFGRLDAFPPGDVGVARGLAGRLGDAATPEELALRFAPQQGMLYFSSLVAQLATRGLVHL